MDNQMNKELDAFLRAVIGLGLITLIFVVITSVFGCSSTYDACVEKHTLDVQVPCVHDMTEQLCTWMDEAEHDECVADNWRNWESWENCGGRARGNVAFYCQRLTP